MDSKKYVIGIDGGTESLRAAVFNSTGHMLGSASSPYDTQFPQPGWAEQRPEDWWAALGVAVRGALAAAGCSGESVAALCVDTTCCTVVAADADGNPLRPALLWMDMRSATQAAKVAAADDPALQVNGGGAGPVSAEWMVPKALWLAECEPATYRSAALICEYQDWINLRLTGRVVGAANNMAVRWHWDEIRGPPLSLLAKLGLFDLPSKWPPASAVLPPGALVGPLTAPAAQHLGLPPGIPVAQGGADAFIGMLGLGVVQSGHMALLTGSSHLHLGLVPHPLYGTGFFGTYSGAVLPGMHVIEGGQTSSGSVLAWFRRTLCPPGTSYSQLDQEAAAVPPGCEGLTALDHFQGNRTPHTDPLSRGALVGLTLRHGRGHIWRALMESVAAGTALVLRAMTAAGYSPTCLTTAGGATHSPLWLQMHADMTGLPLRLTRCPDAPMLGCAILAATAVGMYDNISAAAAAMVSLERVVQPDPAAAATYRPVLARYTALYPALAPIFHGKYDNGEPYGIGTAVLENPESPQPQAGVTKEKRTEQAFVSDVSTQPALVRGDSAVEEDGGPHSTLTATPTTTAPSCCPSSQPAHVQPAAADVIAVQVAESGTGAVSYCPRPHPRPPAVQVAASILAADFAALGGAVVAAGVAGAEWVHVDVFDGSWAGCPNFTVGPPVVAALGWLEGRPPLDCHVAVQHPGRYIDALAAAGAARFTFHWEVLGVGSCTAAEEAAALAAAVRQRGMAGGVALAPDTPLADELIALAQKGAVDMVLLLCVSPGFGGQVFQSAVLPKIAALRAACPDLTIEVDGGINPTTAPAAVAAGADVLVAGSFLYGHPQGLAAGLVELRAAVAGSVANGSCRT